MLTCGSSDSGICLYLCTGQSGEKSNIFHHPDTHRILTLGDARSHSGPGRVARCIERGHGDHRCPLV